MHQDEPEDQAAQIAILSRAIEEMAQAVHQGAHTDIAGTWKTCPRHVCTTARLALGVAGGE